MAEPWRLTAEQWEAISAHLPDYKPSPKGGRPRAEDKKCFQGILWVLRTGAQWEALPRLGYLYASYATCWRRLNEWMEAGIFLKMLRAFLAILNDDEQIDWKQAFIDGTFASAKKGVLTSGKPRRAKEQRSCLSWMPTESQLESLLLPRLSQR